MIESIVLIIMAVVVAPIIIKAIVEYYKHLFETEKKQYKKQMEKNKNRYSMESEKWEDEDRTIEKIFNGRG